MEGFVYLIGEENDNGRYKIGSTRKHKIEDRLKQLQTGNSEKLFIKSYYHTDYPFKLEKMLHNRFKSCNVNGEWFELNEDYVTNFHETCDKLQHIIDSLKDNPFFLKNNKSR